MSKENGVRVVIGQIMRGSAMAMFFIIELPILWRLDHLPYPNHPDLVHGLIVAHNCHGVTCYITPFDDTLETVFFLVGALAFLLMTCGEILVRRARTRES